MGWGRGDTVSGKRTVVLSGVGVIPGQYIFADSSGAVMIPPGDLERALAKARSIQADDARYREEIAREDGPAP